jgi:hypothetical protein
VIGCRSQQGTLSLASSAGGNVSKYIHGVSAPPPPQFSQSTVFYCGSLSLFGRKDQVVEQHLIKKL